MRARFARTTALGGALVAALATVTGTHAAQAASVQVSDSCSVPDAPYLARCFAQQIVQPTAAAGIINPYTTAGGYGPADLLAAYNLPNSTTTATVAIIDAYDDPSAESDLAAYRANYGLTPCTSGNGCFSKVNQTGAAHPLPTPDSGWSEEISLDLDMVSAICASCHILLVEANSNGYDLYTAVDEAVALGAKYVSMSWGSADTSSDPYSDSAFASTGVAFVASSGDTSYGVSYPASSPDVLAVGGTSLAASGGSRGWSENVWQDSSGGPGSGCSAYESKPAYQSGISSSVCAGRAVTDVSAVADPYTGVAVYDGGWGVFGGTSAAAPIIAATYALAGTPAAGSRPASYPYQYSQYLNDVTSGSNGSCSPSVLCHAATGWDGPTGLGTPNGTGAFSATGTQLTRTTAPVTTPPVTAPPVTTSPVTTPPVTTPPVVTAPVTTPPVVPPPVTAPPVTQQSCLGQRVLDPTFASSRGWSGTKGVLRRGSARLDGYGRPHTDRLSQALVLPARCAAILRVNLAISTKDSRANADSLSVTVNGHRVALLTNRSRSGTLSVNLSRYAGQRIVLSFTGTENASRVTAFTIRSVSITS